MKIGVISADSASEKRVALTPDAVKKLRKLGFEVVIQSGAGVMQKILRHLMNCGMHSRNR